MSVNTGNFITDLFGASVDTKVSRCRKYTPIYPSLTPVINSLSVTTCQQGIYTEVVVSGLNFLPFGKTVLNFGSYKNLTISYLGSFNVSFVVPVDATPGTYAVQMANIVSTQVIPTYTYSNSIDFVVI